MTQLTSTAVRDAIAAANDLFMAAFNRGDAAGLAALYSENGWLLPPNGDFLKGREAIQGFWQSVIEMGVNKAKMEIVEVEGHGDTIIEVSTFKLYAGEEQEVDNGKYIVIWKQEDGQWKLYRDIFNSSNPAPG